MTPNASLSNKSVILPKARVNDLVVQKIGSDLLVYDTLTEKAHHLNETTASVWKKCDGTTTIEEMSQELSKASSIKIEKDFVLLALRELDKVNLLVGEALKNDFAQLSRRKVLFKYAAPTLAIPVVMSLVAPASGQMASCIGDGMTDCVITPCCPPLTCVPFAVGVGGVGMCVPPVMPE